MARRLLNPLDYAGEPRTHEGARRMEKAYLAYQRRRLLECLRVWGPVAILLCLWRLILALISRDQL